MCLPAFLCKVACICACPQSFRRRPRQKSGARRKEWGQAQATAEKGRWARWPLVTAGLRVVGIPTTRDPANPARSRGRDPEAICQRSRGQFAGGRSRWRAYSHDTWHDTCRRAERWTESGTGTKGASGSFVECAKHHC